MWPDWSAEVQALSTAKLVSGLDGAVTKGELSEAETNEVLQVDLVVRGKRREDGTEVYLVAKISWQRVPTMLNGRPVS